MSCACGEGGLHGRTKPAAAPACVLVCAQDSHLHWSSEMALRLLQEQHKWRGASPGEPPSPWSAWLASLPRDVYTPLQFSSEELELIGDADMMAGVANMQACARACCEVGCCWHKADLTSMHLLLPPAPALPPPLLPSPSPLPCPCSPLSPPPPPSPPLPPPRPCPPPSPPPSPPLT